MAAGDGTAAAAAGMDIVPGSTPANTIDTEITKSRDYIAMKATRNADNQIDIWVQAAAPAHKAGRVWIKS